MNELFKELVLRNYRKIQELGSANSGVNDISTGFQSIDDFTSGFSNGNLITVASESSMGSTSFVLSMLTNLTVKKEIPSLYMSLSMTREELASRLIANVCDIHCEKIRSGQMSPYEWGQLDCKVKDLYNSPLYISDEPFMSINKIIDDIRDSVKEKGVKIVVIDYLQRIYSQFTTPENRYNEISYFTRTLKSLAMELSIPIVIVSQINRNLNKRDSIYGKRPVLSDLRDSGTIEGDSDMVLMIYRPEYYYYFKDYDGTDLQGMAEIIIAKHRNGARGIIRLKFEKEFGRFSDSEDFRQSSIF